MQGICATRGGNFLGGDPHTSSKFFIKQLTKVCFSRREYAAMFRRPCTRRSANKGLILLASAVALILSKQSSMHALTMK